MGILLAVVSAVSFAVMAVLVRLAGQRGGADNGVIVALLVNVCLHATIVLGRSVSGVEVEWVLAGVVWFVASGILTTLLGRLTLYAGIERLGPSRAAPIKNLSPFVTVLAAFLLLGERVGPVAGAGVVLALASYGLILVEGLSRARAMPAATGQPAMVGGAAGGAVTGAPTASAAPTATAARGTGRLAGLSETRIGYLACTAAASFYGVGTILRKVGVEVMPDPYVGALVSASAGLTVYVLYLRGAGRLATALRAVRRERHPYYWLAGVASTVGQLSLFVALSLAEASIVSVVSSSDTVVTLLVGAVVLGRTEGLNAKVVAGAVGIFIATVVIAMG